MIKQLTALASAYRESAREKRALRKAIDDVVSGAVRPFDTIASTYGLKPDTDPNKLIAKYRSWVYTCQQKNARAVANATLRLYATRATGEERSRRKFNRLLSATETARIKAAHWATPRIKAAQEIEEIEEHPLLELWKNVNPHHNQYETMEGTSTFLDALGNSYWYIDADPMDLPADIWLLQSQFIRIVPDERKFIKGYIYGRGQKKLALRPDQVIQFKRFNPFSLWYGMGRIEGAYWAIEGHESQEKYEFAQTENHAIKDVLIKYKGITDAKKRADLVREWSHAMNVASRNHSPMVADMDFDVQEMQWSPREMAFLQGRQWRKEEIIDAHGQSPALYDKNANRANIEGAIMLWQDYETAPTLTLIQEKLNEQLIPRYNEPRLFVAYDPISGADPEHERNVTDMLLRNGYPLNRVLAKLGKDPVDGGDVGYINNTLTPLGSSPVPAEIQPDKQAKHVVDKQHGDSPGVHLITIKADGGADVELTGGANPPLTSKQRTIAGGVKEVWQAQTTLALEEVQQRGAEAGFEWVASEDWADEIVKLTSGAIKEEVIIGGLQGSRKIGVQMIDFIDRPEVQNAIRAHNFDFARAVNQASADNLRQQLLTGQAAGESIPELTKRVQDTFDGWEKWRAERVARTESARALMLGQEEQWRESGVVAAKVWDANADSCPFCQEMDGKVAGLGNSYKNVGDKMTVDFNGNPIHMNFNYLSIEGPPLHPNCRCSLQPQLIGE